MRNLCVVTNFNFYQRALEKQAAEYPNTLALSDNEQSLSFAELLEHVKCAANLLNDVRSGLPHGSFLPILVDRTVESAVSVLAAFASGIPFAPLDASSTPTRLLYLWDLLGRPGIAVGGSKVFAESVRVINLTFPGGTSGAWGGSTSQSAEGTEDGLVITTSGSTGRPKGVVWSQATTVERLRYAWKRFDLTVDRHRIPSFAPLHFVGGLTAMAMVLFGASVHLLDPNRYSPREFLEKLERIDPTQVLLTPHMARVLSGVVANKREIFPSLEQITTGADLARFEYFQGLKSAVDSSVRLLHIFGSSEAPSSFSYVCELGEIPSRGQIPLGEVVNHAEVHLDPVGDDRFEVWRSGPIATKYLGDPVENDGRFVIGKTGVVWWRSGDVVRRDKGETWFFDSRIGDLVKIRGMLASPSEAQHALQLYPEIRSSVVTVENIGGSVHFVAHVETRPGASLGPGAVRAWLGSRLPAHLVPSHIRFYDKLPLTDRGKVDLMSLRKGSVSYE